MGIFAFPTQRERRRKDPVCEFVYEVWDSVKIVVLSMNLFANHMLWMRCIMSLLLNVKIHKTTKWSNGSWHFLRTNLRWTDDSYSDQKFVWIFWYIEPCCFLWVMWSWIWPALCTKDLCLKKSSFSGMNLLLWVESGSLSVRILCSEQTIHMNLFLGAQIILLALSKRFIIQVPFFCSKCETFTFCLGYTFFLIH